MRYTVTARYKRLAGARVADPEITLDGKTLRLDANAPGDLMRLVPPGWGNAPLSAWRPLVERAIAKGFL